MTLQPINYDTLMTLQPSLHPTRSNSTEKIKTIQIDSPEEGGSSRRGRCTAAMSSGESARPAPDVEGLLRAWLEKQTTGLLSADDFQGVSDGHLVEARLQQRLQARMSHRTPDIKQNASPPRERATKLQCDDLPGPNLQVDDLNFDHRDPAQVLLANLRALRRELRGAFFPGAVSGAPRGEDSAA